MKVGIVSQYWYDRGGTEVLARQLRDTLLGYGDEVELLFFDVANRTTVERPGMPGTVIPLARWRDGLEALARWGADELIVMLDLRNGLIGHVGAYSGGWRTTLIVNVNNADLVEVRRSPDLAEICRRFVRQYHRVTVLFESSPAARLLSAWQVPYRLARIGIPPLEPTSPGDFRRRHGIAPDDAVLLCVGLIAPLKHQVELLQLLPQVPGRRLVFIGDIYSGTPDYGLAFCDAVVKRTDCLWLDGLPRSEVLEAMAASDLLLFPSQSEGAGLVLLEAMAVRLPWVSTPAVDLAAELQGGVLTSLAELRATVDALLLSPDRRRALGEAGAADQRARWSLGQMVTTLRSWFADDAHAAEPSIPLTSWPSQVTGSELLSGAVTEAADRGEPWCVLTNGADVLTADASGLLSSLMTDDRDAVVLFRAPEPNPPTEAAIVAWMSSGVAAFAVRTAWWQQHGGEAPSGSQPTSVWEAATVAWLIGTARTYLGSVTR